MRFVLFTQNNYMHKSFEQTETSMAMLFYNKFTLLKMGNDLP